MKKAILFDLYDTILKDISFDFNSGIKWLYDTYFARVCTWEELKAYEETFWPLFAKRKEDNSEVCLIRDEVVKLFEKFEVNLPEDLEELDYTIMNQIQKEALLDEVRETLEELQEQGVPMYILSNSIFGRKATERLLEDFGVLQYFTKVYVSADYGVRKPGEKFFGLAIKEILETHAGMERKDILYVGNDYITDVRGAKAAGLDVVWYNVKQLPDEEGICTYTVAKFNEILNVIRN